MGVRLEGFDRRDSIRQEIFSERDSAATPLGQLAQPFPTGEPTIGDRFSNAANAFARALPETIATFPETVGVMAQALDRQFGLPEETNLIALGESIRQFGEENFPSDPRLRDSFYSEVVPNAVGQGLAFVLGGFAGRALGLGAKLTTITTGAAVASAQGYRSAKQQGASEEDAFVRYLVGLTLLGPSEAVPIYRMLNRLDKASGRTLKRAFIEAAKEGGEEAIQEFLQTIGENIADVVILDSDVNLMEGAFTGGAAGDDAPTLRGVPV